MRIALMPSAYPPSLGGVEELSRHLALNLYRRGHSVEVWTQQLGTLDAATVETVDGLIIRRFPFPLPRSNPAALAQMAIPAIKSVSALRRAALDYRPDLLHVQCFGPNGAYATLLSYLIGLPLIVSLQGETVMDDADIFDTSATLRTALRIGLRRAAGVTACSAFTLDDAGRFGLTPNVGQVVFNGVDASATAGSRLDNPISCPRYVLAIGRVVEKKGFDLLIDAFAQLAGRHPDVQLVIAGSGPKQSELHQQALRLGLSERVIFPGRLSREEVAVAMREAEAVVMPSRLEPFGIVVLEGWRAGVPVVATSRGGAPEFVTDGVTGLLADPFDRDQLADRIDELLVDPDKARRIGLAGHREVARYDWPIVSDHYLEIYRRLLART